MEDQITVENIENITNKCQISKSLYKQNHVINLLMKPTNQSPVSVRVELTPLADIKDQEKSIEGKSKKQSRNECDVKITRIDLTHHLQKKRSRVDLKRLKLPDRLCNDLVSNPDNTKLSVHECVIKITRIDLTHHLQKKRAKVDLKRLKLPDRLCNDLASNNNKSRVDLSSLKSNPRTIKDRQNNEKILLHFNENHSDDVFDSVKISNYFSKLNLLESSFSSDSSDEEGKSDTNNNSPITKHIPNFGGLTPDHIHGKDDDETISRSSQLAFVHKTLAERKKQHISMRNRLPQGIAKLKNGTKEFANVFNGEEYSFSKKKSGLALENFLSELAPALLVNMDKSQQDISEDETEHYFVFDDL